MSLPTINLRNPKDDHRMIIAREGERVLTPQQNREYEEAHPDARKEPMRANVYDFGGMISGAKDYANRVQKAADEIPDTPPTQGLNTPAPQYLGWAYDDGGLVGKITSRAKDIYSDMKKYPAALQEPMSGIAATGKNVEEYNAAQRPAMKQPYAPTTSAPADRINPSAKFGDRPGEKRIDTTEMTKPLYDDGGVVESEDDEKKAAAMRQAETEVNAEERGRTPDQVIVDIGGAKAFPNPKGIKPQMDTEAPETHPDKPVGTKMSTENAPLKPPTMNADRAPLQGMGGITESVPASIKTPRPEKMNYAPAEPEPAAEKAPDPMEVIQQDKLAAMKKGTAGLSDLGTSLIHERLMKGENENPALTPETPAMPQYTGTERIGKGTPGEAEAHKQFEDKRQDYDKRIQAAMDQGTPEGDREAASLQLAKSHFERMNPFGSAANRPGVMGKLGHIAARIGEGALDAYAGPAATAALVPGSPEARNEQEEQLRKQEAGATKESLEQAQAKAAGVKNVPSDKYEVKNVQDTRQTLPDGTPNPNAGKTVVAGVNKTDPTDVQFTGQLAPPQVEKPETHEQHVNDYAALRSRVQAGEKLSPEEQKQLGTLQTQVSVGDENAKQYNDRIKDLGIPNDIASHYNVLPTDTDAEAKQKEAAAQSLETRRTAKTEKGTEQAGKVFDKYSASLDKLSAPITASSQRSDLLVRNLDQKNKQGDALVAPELLSIAAGGAGSGLRMNEAEISRVIGGRSAWDALKAEANKVSQGNGTFDDNQRAQLHQIATYINERNGSEISLLSKGRDALLRDQDNEAGIRGTYQHIQQALSDITSKGVSPAGSKVKSGDYVYHNGEVLKVTVGKDGKPQGTPIEF